MRRWIAGAQALRRPYTVPPRLDATGPERLAVVFLRSPMSAPSTSAVKPAPKSFVTLRTQRDERFGRGFHGRRRGGAHWRSKEYYGQSLGARSIKSRWNCVGTTERLCSCDPTPHFQTRPYARGDSSVLFQRTLAPQHARVSLCRDRLCGVEQSSIARAREDGDDVG